MSLDTAIFAALRTLVGNRVRPVLFPQPPATAVWPAIRYTIQTFPIIDQCGDGDDETAETRIQLDIVTENYDQARALRLQVMARMKIFEPPVTLEYSSSEPDEETKTFREILQYSVHGSSPEGSP